MGCGFVSYQFHNSAKMAIETLNGTVLNGWTIRLSWGNAPVIPYQPSIYYDPYYYYYPPMQPNYYPISYSTDSNLTIDQNVQEATEVQEIIPEAVRIREATVDLEQALDNIKLEDKQDSGEDDVKTL